MPQRREAAIVGIHEYPSRLVGPGTSALQIKASSVARALEDAGLSWSDINAVYDTGSHQAIGGLGSVYTFSVIMQSRHPAFKDLGPYAVGYVNLDEGFRIMTNIVGVDDPIGDIECGMRVKLVWEDQGEGEVSLPMFEAA